MIQKESTFCTKNKNGLEKYCRTLHQKERDYAQMISNLYQVPYSFITCSGLNAIDIALRSYSFRYRNHDIFCFHSSELYQETRNVLESVHELGLIHSIQSFDIGETIEKLFKQIQQIPSTAEVLIFVESCSNPNGHVFDFESFSLNKNDNTTLIVDNTWFTGFNFNPFHYGADIVLESLSKYMSSGQLIAGSISTKSDIFGEFYLPHSIKSSGIHITPASCKVLIQNFENIESRMVKSWEKTIQLLTNLQKVENVVDIIHPFLIHHPSHSIFNRLVKTKKLPSVFVIIVRVPQGRKHFDQMLKLWKINQLTSFGGEMSRIDTSFEFIQTDKVKMRVSIGFSTDEKFNDDFICFVESLKQQ